jgi:uncharacterized protein YbaA (DUF1428 family)
MPQLCSGIPRAGRISTFHLHPARTPGDRLGHQEFRRHGVIIEGSNMTLYVDGFVVPVPKKNRAQYTRMTRLMGKVWREHGALEYRECIADDVPKGKLTSFPRALKLKSTEVVWFSYVVCRSHRDHERVFAKVMKDPRLAKYMNPKGLPFDGKRAIFGSFKAVVDL